MSDIAQQDMSYQPKTQAYAFSANAPAPQPAPADPQSKQKPKGKTNPFILLALEIAGLIVVFIVFLIILNFFNVISLRSIYPKQLGWLPHLNQNAKAPRSTLEYNTMASTPIGNCPLPNGCRNAVQIGDLTSGASQNFSGLGFNLAGSGSAILAVIDGKINVTNTTENGETLTVVTITDPGNIQKFVYKFNKESYSSAITSGDVKQNQEIGNFKTGGTIIYQSKTYSFTLEMYSFLSKQYLKLESSVGGLTIDHPNK